MVMLLIHINIFLMRKTIKRSGKKSLFYFLVCHSFPGKVQTRTNIFLDLSMFCSPFCSFPGSFNSFPGKVQKDQENYWKIKKNVCSRLYFSRKTMRDQEKKCGTGLLVMLLFLKICFRKLLNKHRQHLSSFFLYDVSFFLWRLLKMVGIKISLFF